MAGLIQERESVFDVPLPQNRFFTGRTEILKGLRDSFDSGERVQALSGMPGVGKTQTALEYAYRNRPDYQFVFWCKAHSRETLLAELASIAKLLDLPQNENEDQNVAVNAVKRWLENNEGWLLILDNADDVLMVSEFIPSRETGNVLLTTRASYTGTTAERNAVVKMDPEEGALLLLRRSGKLKKGAAIESVSEEMRKEAEALSVALDGLPLALDQAAAFIGEAQSTPGKYLGLYQVEKAEMMARRGDTPADHPSVTSTFSLAFKKLEEASPTAADLLRVCTFLEADAIPEEIFSKGAKELGDFLSLFATNPLSLNQVITEAGRFSLLQRNPNDTVSLHRLEQSVLKGEMDDNAQRIWVERIIKALSTTFPDEVEYSNWSLCGRLIPHTQILASHIHKYGLEFPEAALMMNQSGHYLSERGQHAEAEPLFKRALDIREKALGPEHPDTAMSLGNLAGLYDLQGRYAEAEPLHKRALAIREKGLGPEHPSTGTSLSSLATLYNSQGRYAEAEPLFKRALDISEKALGPEHRSTATSLNNLALLYQKKGNNLKAEPLYKRALAAFEKALGWEHPDLAKVLLNYAQLLRSMHRGFDAGKLEARAKKIQSKQRSKKQND